MQQVLTIFMQHNMYEKIQENTGYWLVLKDGVPIARSYQGELMAQKIIVALEDLEAKDTVIEKMLKIKK